MNVLCGICVAYALGMFTAIYIHYLKRLRRDREKFKEDK